MVSYEGIGQWTATFGCEALKEGQPVKIIGNGEVGPCSEGDAFCGVVIGVDRDGAACAVAMGGMVCLPYTGTAPALGWTGLAGNGSGGVKAAEGREYLVVDVDESAAAVTFAL